ncbi:hypothetical protein L6164_013777 [Bauhinia variegata]|uniref:Uncharacterized protein n=1 Tax=Bauhinia variegata TaxID=167791 RepID=A0ACB9NF39_BAUVA|nr:hypothetical protein L6164_013777 [Bauhinia variegata]
MYSPKLNDVQEEESYSYAMQLARSIALAMALHTGTELKVFYIIAKSGPDAKLSAVDIAAQIASKNPEAATMLDHDGMSLGNYTALIQTKRQLVSSLFSFRMCKLKDAVVEGGVPFNRVHGYQAFEYPGLDARFNKVFNTAMISLITMAMKKIVDVEIYNGFEGINTLVDVSGGFEFTRNRF